MLNLSAKFYYLIFLNFGIFEKKEKRKKIYFILKYRHIIKNLFENSII